jgi:hypothetical protein
MDAVLVVVGVVFFAFTAFVVERTFPKVKL